MVHDEDGAVLVERSPLQRLPPAVASRLVRRAASSLGAQLEADQVTTLLRLAARQARDYSLANGLEASVEADFVRFEIVAG